MNRVQSNRYIARMEENENAQKLHPYETIKIFITEMLAHY